MSVDKIKMYNGSAISFTDTTEDSYTGMPNYVNIDLDNGEIPLLDEIANSDSGDDSDYLGIEGTLLSLGYSQSQVNSFIEEWQQESANNKNARVYLRHSVRMLHLQMYCNWDNLDEKGKRALLWDLGINTKTENYYTEHCLVRNTDKQGHGNCGKLCWEEVVFGNERIDSEWVEKRDSRGDLVSSFEARTYERRARDHEYDKELSRLGGAL